VESAHICQQSRIVAVVPITSVTSRQRPGGDHILRAKAVFSLVRFQVLTAASMKLKFVFWDVLPCEIIVDRRFRGTCCLLIALMEAARTSETSVDNYFTRQYISEGKSELKSLACSSRFINNLLVSLNPSLPITLGPID
jgi:hypothetical protein